MVVIRMGRVYSDITKREYGHVEWDPLNKSLIVNLVRLSGGYWIAHTGSYQNEEYIYVLLREYDYVDWDEIGPFEWTSGSYEGTCM